jgi:hypothetical protein
VGLYEKKISKEELKISDVKMTNEQLTGRAGLVVFA